jgi:hypothetical protein
MREPELLLLVLMVAVGGFSVLAGTIRVPYPILLVLGGLVLGFLPGVPPAELPPDLVLVLFLPPLLYQAAFFSSPRDLRADTRAITLLAVGLVLATMSAVAAVAHAQAAACRGRPRSRWARSCRRPTRWPPPPSPAAWACPAAWSRCWRARAWSTTRPRW